MPSGQMVRLKYGRIQPGLAVRQTIQQMKGESVLRSETRQGQTGGSKAFVIFAFLIYLRNLDFISLTNESPWRTFNVLVHCFARIFFVYLFHFGSRTFICAFTIFVSLPPSPCSHFYISVLSTFWSQCFTLLSPISNRMMLQFRDFESLALCVTMAFLFGHYLLLHILLQCASYFNALVTFMSLLAFPQNLRQCTIVH